MTNVALFGHMGSGKTTVADVLSRKGYQRISFAGPLKAVAELAYGKIDKGQDYEVVDSATGLSHRLSGREILQGIGQTIKGVDRDFWLRCFIRQANTFEGTPMVVDDGRFLFEFEAIKRLGWLTVGINTHPSVRVQRYESIYGRPPTESELNHQSEIEVPDILNRCDIIIQGTDDPYANVRKILGE
jgi:dephospho-CoA kinase